MTGALAAGAIGLFAAMPAAQARDAGWLGGGGGAEYRSTCNPGSNMIGVNVMSGSALNRIAPICIPINENGDWTGTAYEAPAAGGPGGSYQKLACEPGWAVTEFRIFMDANKIVNQVAITCVKIATGDQVIINPKHTGGKSIGDVNFVCNPDELATGIYGRSGALVDQTGLQCEKAAFYVKQANDAAAAKAKAKADKAAGDAAAKAANDARNAEIAEESQVTGKTADQCQASFGRCQNRCQLEANQAGGIGTPGGAGIFQQCNQLCGAWVQQCVANAAQDAAAAAGGGNPPPGGGGGGKTVTVKREVTGYDAPDGNDQCYLDKGDTAQLLGTDPNDSKWKHLHGTSGNCDGQDFWVYNNGELSL